MGFSRQIFATGRPFVGKLTRPLELLFKMYVYGLEQAQYDQGFSNLDGPTDAVNELSQAQYRWMCVLRLVAQIHESTSQLLTARFCLRSGSLPDPHFDLYNFITAPIHPEQAQLW